MEISKAFRTSLVTGSVRARPDAGNSPRLAQENAAADPVASARPVTRDRAAVPVSMGELVEAADREKTEAAYEGLSNRAKMALAAYLTQQNAHQDEAKAEMSQMLGVDYYA